MNIAIIFAGGKGERLNSNSNSNPNCNQNSIPKQFIKIDNKPILIHTLENFQNHKLIDKIYLATLKDYLDYTIELVEKYNLTKVKKVIEGDNCAMGTIYKTLVEAQKENPKDSVVLIHDGVRPIIKQEVITNNIKTTLEKSNAITVIPTNETIILSEDGANTLSVPIRKTAYKAQAPQSFFLGEIIEAHEKIRKTNPNYTDIVDNCTLYQILNKNTNLTLGNFGNIKITTIEDIYLLEGILNYFKKENTIGS